MSTLQLAEAQGVDWSSVVGLHDILATVCKQWHAHTKDDRLWSARLAEDFQVNSNADPDGKACATAQQAYAGWMKEYVQYGPLARRVRAAWHTIHSVLQRDAPNILLTLRPGLSEEALDKLEEEHGQDFTPTMRMMYRVHDGQRLLNQEGTFYGIFGSYKCYDHAVSMYMLPASKALSNRLCLACSGSGVLARWRLAQRYIMIDGERDLPQACNVSEVIPMCPPQVQGVCPVANPPLLRWFEAYAEALRSGMLRADFFIHPPYYALAINLFPQSPPHQQTAMTNGVIVCVSTLTVYERNRSDEVAYEVRLSMPSEDEWPADVPRMVSCQLRSRRWRILNNDLEMVDTVFGPGVVGEYPLLVPGAEHVYRSRTFQIEGGGFMEGEFHFVPGTLDDPLGQVFSVTCPRFSLAHREFMF